MEMLIITGLSGSGKSRAINALEDMGFFCVDNLPTKLISKFAEIKKASKGGLNKIAIVTDIRGGWMFSSIFLELEKLEKFGVQYKILFFDANDETLKKRFNETRRKHPLIGSDGCFNIEKAIEKERKALDAIKDKADYIIDTSILTNSQLKEHICKLFLKEKNKVLIVEVLSFGFKYGDISRADLIFDVRCLPNPYYVEDLKFKSGKEKEVREYIMSFSETKTLLEKLEDLFKFLLPLYVKEGKSQLTVAFGCTGGAHRSVMFAEHFYKEFLNFGYEVNVNHRDLYKNF